MAPKPKGSVALMFKEKDWKFAQAGRLEVSRHAERGERDTWFDSKRARAAGVLRQQDAAAWSSWGSWWSTHGDQEWGAHWWSPGEGWWAEAPAEPDPGTTPWEPTAPGAASSSDVWNNLTPEEDKTKLRLASLAPISFQPQRWITYVQGRPVVVLRGGGVQGPSTCIMGMRIMSSDRT